MVLKGNFTRINTAELKALIYEKVGHKRAQIYFNLLTRLFSAKISKSDFDKLCIRTVGREHLSLHNHFIRSLLKNASLSKVPPPKVIKSNGYQKKRSPRDRNKGRERPSPLGPLGKTRSPTLDQSPTELNSLGEEIEQINSPCVDKRTPPIKAPLGVSLNFGGGSRKQSIYKEDPSSKFHSLTCQNSGELPDSMSLRGRLEHRLLSNGLGVSADCVNLLNNGLDVFLKRLMEPGLGLARSRFGVQRQAPPSICMMSTLDFRVSMESNPRMLGADWPVQLEKVCSRAYE